VAQPFPAGARAPTGPGLAPPLWPIWPGPANRQKNNHRADLAKHKQLSLNGSVVLTLTPMLCLL